MTRAAIRQRRTAIQAKESLEERVERLEKEIALLAYGDRFRQLVLRVVRLEMSKITES